jgi:BirA family biotin operon repressor/biotin-[acetyl-CoA-carboxylase] ligase
MSFDAERFAALAGVRALGLGRPLTALSSVTSSNDLALGAARDGAPHGATFVADEQTLGRGRQGRQWFARPGESLLFSCVLRPSLPAALAHALPLAVGLAVRSVAARHVPDDVEVLLKWPNDVLASGRKICGVLIESTVRGSELAAGVVGVGLNVRTRFFPHELALTAASLASLGGAPPSREELLVDLLSAIEDFVRRVSSAGLGTLALELDQYDALKGRRIAVDEVTGRARGLDPQGRLIMVDDQGTERVFVSGHVQLLHG